MLRALFHNAEFLIRLGIATFFPNAQKQILKQKFADDAWLIIGTKLGQI
jgi:hypothetical protein